MCFSWSRFGHWDPLQAGFCVLLTCSYHSLSGIYFWVQKNVRDFLDSCTFSTSALKLVISPWNPDPSVENGIYNRGLDI